MVHNGEETYARDGKGRISHERPSNDESGLEMLHQGKESIRGLEPCAPLVEALSVLDLHDHICLIYESEEEWASVVRSFFAIGFDRREKCIYITSAHTTDQIRDLFRRDGTDVVGLESAGSLLILDHSEMYTKDGHFDSLLMVQRLRLELDQAIEQGYKGVRSSGEMGWAEAGYPGSELLMEYESIINDELFAKYPWISLCQYDRWRFPQEIIKGVFLTHPYIIRSGKLYSNFYYMPPDKYLGQKRAEWEVDTWLSNLDSGKSCLSRSYAPENGLDVMFRYRLSPPSGFEYLSPSVLELTGYTPEEFYRDPRLSEMIIHPDDRALGLSIKESASIGSNTMRWVRKDGKTIWIELISIRALNDGNAGAIEGIAKDVTNRTLVNDILIREKRFSDSLVENMPIGVAIIDKKFVLKRFNNAYSETIRKYSTFPLENALGVSIFQLFPGVKAQLRDWFKNVLESGKPQFRSGFRLDILSRKGLIKTYWDVSLTPALDSDGRVDGLIILAEDVTARVEAEGKVQEQVQFLNTLVNAIPVPIFCKDSLGRYLGCNHAYEELLGMKEADIIGNTVFDISDEELAARYYSMDQALFNNTGTQVYDSIVRDFQGMDHEVIFSQATFTKADGSVGGIVGAIVDVTEQEEANRALIESQKNFLSVLDSLDSLVYVSDFYSYKILYANHKIKEFYGEDLEGKVCWKVMEKGQSGPCHFCRNSLLLDEDGLPTKGCQFDFKSKRNGRWLTAYDIAIEWPDGRLVKLEVAHDITERKEMEKEIRYRLAVRELVSDISTRFLNIIGEDLDKEVMNCLRLLGDFLSADDCFVCIFTPDEKAVDRFHQWSNPALGAFELLSRGAIPESFSWAIDALRKNDTFSFYCETDDSEDGSSIRSWCSSKGVESFVAVPLFLEGLLLGLLGLDCRRAERRWKDDELAALRLIGNLFSGLFWRKRTEERLSQSEAKYRQIVETANEGIWAMDGDCRTTFVNNKIALLLGYEISEMVGKRVTEFMFPEDLDFHDKNMEHRRAGSFGFYEQKVRRKDGTAQWLQVSATALIDKDGRFAGSFAMFTDINERKKVEDEREESRRRMSELIDYLPDATFVIDQNGVVIAWNKAIEEMTSVPKERMLGKGDYEYSIPFYGDRRPILIDLVTKSSDELEKKYSAIKRDGNIIMGEAYMPYLKGGTVYLAGTAAALYDLQGNLYGAIEAIRDITDRKHMEEALLLAKEAAESAAKAKSDFLASMSHEIRTPLNAIIGMSSLLMEERLTPEQLDSVETIRRSGDALLEIINDVLDFSKIEKGMMELERIPFSLDSCIEASIDLLALKAAEKGLVLSYFIESGQWQLFKGDVSRVRQVLANLLSNAVKFTDNGSVTVSARALRQPDNRWVILFEVKDTGIGISKDVRERLFQPFTQGDTSMTRLFGGTGLGLAISKKLVEIMGGRIWLESEPGVGSTFSFTITVDGAGELQQQREKEVPSRPIHMVAAKKGKLRLLLAEDNQTNQKVILRMLKKIGYTADVAANGKEVLEALSIRTYDLILMDIQMPEMDGLEASRIIRSNREKRASPWIIAITAYAMNGDRERCIKAGMDNYISKPVQMDELKSVLHIYEDKLIEGDGGGSNCAWCDEE